MNYINKNFALSFTVKQIINIKCLFSYTLKKNLNNSAFLSYTLESQKRDLCNNSYRQSGSVQQSIRANEILATESVLLCSQHCEICAIKSVH